MRTGLIRVTERGLYCEAGDFYIDPWRGVERAIITHAHSDHARRGSKSYLTARDGEHVLRERLGPRVRIETVAYGQALRMKDAVVSLHPAGHLLGSAQVRIECDGRVVVVSGDYKTQEDPTCAALETVPCDEFVTEATFALPVYRWPAVQEVFDEINAWWRENQLAKRTSVIFAYALGKAQRIMAGVDASIGPIVVHDSIARLCACYEASGVKLPRYQALEPAFVRAARGQALVIAPQAVRRSRLLARLGPLATAMASGWMLLRESRRRMSVQRGFVLSDHADWDGLLATIRATGAGSVGVMHGNAPVLTRYLRERGWDAYGLSTRPGEQEASGGESSLGGQTLWFDFGEPD